jgi:GAF domain-containing protein
MAEVILLPVRNGSLAIPLADGSVLRLIPCRESPHVLLALYGPRGGNAGGVVLHAERAGLLGSWLGRAAARWGLAPKREAAGAPEPAVADAPRSPLVLGAELDTDAATASLARLAVPSFADWWSLDLVEQDGSLRRLALANADGSKERAARRLSELPPDPRAASPRAEVLRTGQPNIARRVTDARLVAGARSAEHLELLRSLGCRSSIVVPLLVRQRVIGMMTFVTAESGRRYDEDDVAAAVAFGRCASLAVKNALLYRRAQAALQRRADVTRRRRSRRSG